MRKLKYYLETTIFNFVFADDAPEKKEATKRFFQEWPNLNAEMYISEVVNEEISRATKDIQTKLIKIIQEYNPVLLPMTEEVGELAEKYVAERIIPEKFKNDARHIAVAVVHNMNVIVSWNMEHIVRLKTKLGIEGINRSFGYQDIEIMTPEEVL